MSIINYNGQTLPGDELILSAENRGFFYGDGFFETIRLIDGYAVHLEDHLDRMNRSFQFLQIEPPFTPDFATLDTMIRQLAELNNIQSGGRVRLTIFRESGGYYTPNHDRSGYLMQCSPLAENNFELNRNGLHLTLYNQNRKPVSPLCTLKTLNSILYVLAGIFARNQGLDDALIMNSDDSIIESTHSNLFIVKDNRIITPGVDDGCIPGVMRRNILKIIENKTAYDLQRRSISQKDLLDADEVFLTNAIKGIQWVVGFKEKRYYHKVSSHLASLLARVESRE